MDKVSLVSASPSRSAETRQPPSSVTTMVLV
jgi:hypothetical protein